MRRFIAYLLFVFLLASAVSAYAQDFNSSTFTPWDIRKASKKVGPREHKPYTIMLYMNGSDLESEAGAATDDLIEILDSGMDSRNVHFIILTGGTKRWHNTVVPANECVLWEVEDGLLYKTAGIGRANMGDPGTLSSFISFGMQNYPADKYGLIMWDHGGGSIAGYGHDEKFIEGNLTLLDMKTAFEEAGLGESKLEFLGFDSCLMATVEMAVVASDYAKVLIASEDLEPGEGWDYYFLSVFNQYPRIDGMTLGAVIVDYFMEYYGHDTDEVLSLSVADLRHAQAVMDAVGDLMRLGYDSLKANERNSFNNLAGRRVRTKTFGEGSPRDNESDMVDIGDMANKLADLYPAEAAAVIDALNQCVVYNRHNSDVDLKGLSTYYIYGGKEWGVPSLNTYASLNVNASYTRYLRQFFDALTSGAAGRNRSRAAAPPVSAETVLWQPVAGKKGTYRLAGISEDENTTLWPTLNKQFVCLYPAAQSQRNKQYAIPAQVNGKDCDIIVLFNEKNPTGLVEGARYKDGPIIQKGFDPIEPGDKVAIYSLEINANGKTSWHKGRTLTVRDGLSLSWAEAPDGYGKGQKITDIKGDAQYITPEIPPKKEKADTVMRPAAPGVMPVEALGERGYASRRRAA
jgi:hypothetical protein